MKTKKLFLPIIILTLGVLAVAVCSIFINIEKKPTITEGDFPFSITYELNGESVTIKDVYKVHYVENDGNSNYKSRVYIGEIGGMGENNTLYILKNDENGRIELHTHFYADYMMGDSDGDYFDEKPFEPRIYYYDSEEQEYSDEEALSAQGVKLVSFEYPTPIKNSFVFSHISYFDGEIVLPTLFIALVVLAAIVIFVKKEKELVYKTIDNLSIILNFVISFTFLIFVTICGVLIGINGGGSEIYSQIFRFIPAFSALCISASVALRRKGHGVLSLVTQLLGPAAFIICLILGGISELI